MAQNQNILVPFNDTDLSEEALKYACETFPESDITALYVIELQGQEDIYVPQVGEERRKRANDCLQVATDIAGDIPIDTEIQVGKPDQEIIDYAEEENIDMIIMGSHGRTGTARLVLGSVAEKIVRNSSVPVLVMK
jgi:nucleotide-binding universal stress UspA family protein